MTSNVPPTANDILGFFTEIGYLNQLSKTLLVRALPDGVHPSHFAILNYLVQNGEGQSPVHIADAMHVTKNTMTHSLQVLEERGFIATSPNPKDRRGKHVHLTNEGKAFRNKAVEEAKAMFGDVFGKAQVSLIKKVAPDLAKLRCHLFEHRS